MLSGIPAEEQDRVARLTAEMTKAIRRQESNTGLDYWRTPGVNNMGLNTAEKRPTYKKVTQINLNFPGTFLPNVTHGQQQKSRKREQPASAVVLTRSRTTMAPKTTSSSRSQGSSTNSVTPVSKKAMVTDLTCLQLADTLFSSRKSPYAGLLNFWPGRSRYTDYFTDNNSAEDGVSDTLSEICISKQKQASIPSGQRGISIPVLHYKTLPAEEEVLQNNNFRDRYTYDVIPEAVLNNNYTDGSHYLGDKRDLKPQKSILKNGTHKLWSDNKEGRVGSSPETVDKSTSGITCSYKLPATNAHNERRPHSNTDKLVTLDKITPSLQQSGSRPSSNKSDSHTNAKMENALEGLMRDLSSRKRSVRFNSTHEIREYAPCEPVSY